MLVAKKLPPKIKIVATYSKAQYLVKLPDMFSQVFQVDHIPRYCGGVFLSGFPFHHQGKPELLAARFCACMDSYLNYNKTEGIGTFRKGFTKAFAIVNPKQTIVESLMLKKYKGKIISTHTNERMKTVCKLIEIPLR